MEKIDIIEQDVYCYNEFGEKIKSLKLDQFTDVDFSYLEGARLFTLNISQPVKRVVKFTQLNLESYTAEFTEYPYADMTTEQQADFDSFVLQAETL